jgi:DNA-binding transcriptional MocR family regulator
MTIWSPHVDNSGPVYLAITRALESDIASGRITPGSRLPTHRELATELGVNVGTVTRAYGEARRRGLIEGEVGRGTFVRNRPPSALSRIEPESETGPIDLSINVPLAMPSVNLTAVLEGLAREERLDQVMAYNDPAGSPGSRRAGALWLERLGLAVNPEHIVVCAGAQHAILIALGSVAGPGDLVLCESLTYPGFLGAARMLGLRVRGVEIDEKGILPESLEETCRNDRPRLLYCMPSPQNPTCAQIPADRREAISSLAERHDLVIVQDEIQGGLIEDRAPSPAELAPDRVLTIASLSKTLSPGLRIAYLAASTSRVARLSELLWSSVWMAPPLGAEIARRLLEQEFGNGRTGGSVDLVLAARREEIAARHTIAERCFKGLEYVARAGSYHLWVPLPNRWDNASATSVLANRGV